MSVPSDDDISTNAEARSARIERDRALTADARLRKLDDLLRAAAALQALPRKET